MFEIIHLLQSRSNGVEKLAEGIRDFAIDQGKFEAMIEAKL